MLLIASRSAISNADRISPNDDLALLYNCRMFSKFSTPATVMFLSKCNHLPFLEAIFLLFFLRQVLMFQAVILRKKSQESSPKNPTVTAFGNTGQWIATFVTTPNVPSEPMNKCFKWYPVLSFFKVLRQSMIVPSAFT